MTETKKTKGQGRKEYGARSRGSEDKREICNRGKVFEKNKPKLEMYRNICSDL